MACATCGEICRCSPEAVASEPKHAETSTAEDGSLWRQEVSARLNRYHSRRKPRPPRYPSLRLRFEGEESGFRNMAAADDTFSHGPAPPFTHAVALDEFAAAAANEPSSYETSRDDRLFGDLSVASRSVHELDQGRSSSTAEAGAREITAKIIEFPRSWSPAPARVDELAEPVLDRPRILEVPEVTPPPPALGGITIEPAKKQATEKRPGIDFPLQSARLGRRICAAAFDGLIMVAACALFGFIFWKLTGIRPPRLQIIGIAAGLLSLFWAAYQYLLVIYSGSTPGLRLAGLRIGRFDGSAPSCKIRRWRVLASFLSAASLGMGYAWVFLDEDALCWHDRITHTYLAPSGLLKNSSLARKATTRG
jgi:uncharacterized RDD family membrane protein YckC